MRSSWINAISATPLSSMLMRASTSRCRSLAAWYSAFSRRSPSSRARLISFGSSSLSSRSSAWISSSNFLINRSFIVSPWGRWSWYHSAILHPAMTTARISSRQNALVARYRHVARGDDASLILLDGAHLIVEALGSGVTVRDVLVTDEARGRLEVVTLLDQLRRADI